MALTSRKRVPIVTLRKHNKKSVRETGKELGTLKSTAGRIVIKGYQDKYPPDKYPPDIYPRTNTHRTIAPLAKYPPEN